MILLDLLVVLPDLLLILLDLLFVLVYLLMILLKLLAVLINLVVIILDLLLVFGYLRVLRQGRTRDHDAEDAQGEISFVQHGGTLMLVVDMQFCFY
jgi:hypothetical protein